MVTSAPGRDIVRGHCGIDSGLLTLISDKKHHFGTPRAGIIERSLWRESGGGGGLVQRPRQVPDPVSSWRRPRFLST